MLRIFETISFVLILASAGLSLAEPPVEADSRGLAALRSLPTKNGSWKEDTTRFKTFDRTSLFAIIDGGAPDYIDAGLIRGLVEEFRGPDSTSAEVFIEDFGTAAFAKSMLDKKSSEMSQVDTLPGFQKADAVAEKVIGGCFVSAWAGRWYFELSMTGYKSFEKSTSAAAVLLAGFKVPRRRK